MLMCNACGIYYKNHGRHRPVELALQPPRVISVPRGAAGGAHATHAAAVGGTESDGELEYGHLSSRGGGGGAGALRRTRQPAVHHTALGSGMESDLSEQVRPCSAGQMGLQWEAVEGGSGKELFQSSNNGGLVGGSVGRSSLSPAATEGAPARPQQAQLCKFCAATCCPQSDDDGDERRRSLRPRRHRDFAAEQLGSDFLGPGDAAYDSESGKCPPTCAVPQQYLTLRQLGGSGVESGRGGQSKWRPSHSPSCVRCALWPRAGSDISSRLVLDEAEAERLRSELIARLLKESIPADFAGGYRGS